ncbi:Kae1-associated serine/threonine protein kinase [Candidatus Woesearchaeota archaeon]|nr:Kae1-associated serine/threonine protein kinase [Candidatus Woesearchaeota archaeon]
MAKIFLHQGAEAKIFLEGGKIIKERVPKKYRIPQLDLEIRKKNTRAEVRLLTRAKGVINVPDLFNSSDKEMVIEMEFLDGKKLRDVLDAMNVFDRKKALKQIGSMVAELHKSNLIHGDLTTSNMILKDGKIFFLDFGLGFFSTKDEDKAVDIYLLKQALKSKHYKHWKKSFNEILSNYCKNFNESSMVIKRLERVESRGRYKKKKK